MIKGLVAELADANGVRVLVATSSKGTTGQIPNCRFEPCLVQCVDVVSFPQEILAVMELAMKWSGMSRCEAMEMAQFVGKGRARQNAVVAKQQQVAGIVKRMREQFKHVQDVKLNKLFWFANQLTEVQLKELAEKNLSAFHFCLACQKVLDQKQ